LRCWAVGPEVERGAGQAERVSLEKGKRPGEGWIALLWSPAAHPTPSCSASTGPSRGGAREQGRGVGGTQEEGDQFAGNEPGSTLERTSSTVIDSPSSPSNSRPAIIASSYDALRGPPPPPCRRNGDSTEHWDVKVREGGKMIFFLIGKTLETSVNWKGPLEKLNRKNWIEW